MIGFGNPNAEYDKFLYFNQYALGDEKYLPFSETINIIQRSSKMGDKIVLAMSHPTSFVISAHGLVCISILINF